MAFQLIDLENWERREFYEHFINEVVCTYSVVVNIDITNLKGQKLYPAMIWLLTRTVNDMPEFRTSLTPEGLGIYDDMHPMYTVFNKENKNFSGIWSYFSEDYNAFLKSYEDDSRKYSTSTRMRPRRGRLPTLSIFPWYPGWSLRTSTSMCLMTVSSCCRFSPWANSLSGMADGCCRWRSRCTTRSATGIISVCLWRSFRDISINSNC